MEWTLLGVSFLNYVDLDEYIHEVTTAQMTIVDVMMVFVVSLFLRPIQYYWSTFRAKFESEGLSW